MGQQQPQLMLYPPVAGVPAANSGAQLSNIQYQSHQQPTHNNNNNNPNNNQNRVYYVNTSQSQSSTIANTSTNNSNLQTSL